MRLQLDNKDIYIHLVLLSMTNNGSRIVWLLQVLYFLVRQLDVHRLCYSQNSATENARSAERTEQDILIVQAMLPFLYINALLFHANVYT